MQLSLQTRRFWEGVVYQFLVYYQEPVSTEKKEQLAEQPLIESIFALEDRVLLIQTPLADPGLLAAIVDVTGENPKAGVTFKLDGSYSGYFHKDLWDWLEEARNAAAAAK